jgi:hypothetical protein
MAEEPDYSLLPEFISSDAENDALAMDLFRRHLRIVGDPIRFDTGPPVGGGLTLWWHWSNPQYVWFSPEPKSWHDDRHTAFKNHMMNGVIDRFGYHWTAHSGPVDPKTTPMTLFGQGWAFPEYPQSHGNSTGWEWNGDSVEGWTIHGGEIEKADEGSLYFRAYQSNAYLQSPDFKAQAFHAPFIYLQAAWLNSEEDLAETAHQFSVYFTTESEPEFSEDKMVTSCVDATIPLTGVTANSRHKLYFPMHLHPKWDGVITGLRIAYPHGTADVPFLGALDFLRLNYDNRQAVNNPISIIAIRDYVWWTGDLTLIDEKLDDMRRSMVFMLEHLHGRKGLLDVGDFFVGHEGTTLDEDGEIIVGHSIGDGYMDIIAVGPLALEPNIHFHDALIAMADIESLVARRPELQRPMPSVSGPDGHSAITYRETVESLLDLVPVVRDAINDTFWNEDTGRYALSIDARGDLKDFGYTLQNHMMITSGIAPEDRARTIMDWISGKRIVAGDDSQGEDIYFFQFAPRFSTRENTYWYLWDWTIGKRVWIHLGFGDQIQDGGVVLFHSYYDLLCRISVYDADDAWQRWLEIMDWHKDVLEHGGTGGRLYRDYYRGDAMADFPVLEPRDGSLQGGGTSGGLGLDEEFIESGLLFGAWPKGFLGIEPVGYGVLRIAPSPPSDREIRVNQIWFHDARLNVAARDNQIDLRGTTVPNDHQLTVELAFAITENQNHSLIELHKDGVAVNDAPSRLDPDGRLVFRIPLQEGLFSIK